MPLFLGLALMVIWCWRTLLRWNYQSNHHQTKSCRMKRPLTYGCKMHRWKRKRESVQFYSCEFRSIFYGYKWQHFHSCKHFVSHNVLGVKKIHIILVLYKYQFSSFLWQVMQLNTILKIWSGVGFRNNIRPLIKTLPNVANILRNLHLLIQSCLMVIWHLHDILYWIWDRLIALDMFSQS